MKNLKVWPHLTVIAIVVAMVAGAGVAWLMKSERTASAEAVPNAARIQRVEGDVAMTNNLIAGVAGSNNEGAQWHEVTDNQPFSVGDRIYTRDNSRVSVAFTGRNFARLNPNTSLDVLSLSDRQTQLALRDGSAIFDLGYLGSDELFEVATPYGAVDFQEPGLYNVGIDDDGQVLISVLSGLAQVAGLGGSGQISKGEVLTLLGQTAADVVLSRLDGRDAGYLVDDYYAYQYPRYYDGRYRDYNTYLSDPYYFDPYRRSASYQYVNPYIPGLYDLDYYGDWHNVSGYGYAWAPRVPAGWTPYTSGYWMTDYPYGPTWVSSEPWGYAPYHYGRWAFAGDRWYWIPDNSSVVPVYSPALVAFMPFGQEEIGWVPLGPGDAYVPRYYDPSWQPHYLTNADLYQRVVNLNVPGAVTVVSLDEFTRGIDWRQARRAELDRLGDVNPVLDPLLLTPLRNAVVKSAWGRGKKDIPPGIAKKLDETRVYAGTTPAAPPFRRDWPKSLRVDTVSDRVKGQKFKVKDERDVKVERKGRGAPPEVAPRLAEQPRAERGRGANAAREARESRREVRQVERPRNEVQQVQRPGNETKRNETKRNEAKGRSAQAERVERRAQQRPQGERVGRPEKEAKPGKGKGRKP